MLSRAIGTFFGVGLLPWAPGTWGALATLPLVWVLHMLGGFPLLVAATVVVTLLGWWAARQIGGDPSEVVIDEVAGMMLALWPVSIGATHAGVEITALWPGWVTGFIAFRVFDIRKPGPVGWADRLHTPFGVMLDDIIAGVGAALIVAGFAAVAHGAFL